MNEKFPVIDNQGIPAIIADEAFEDLQEEQNVEDGEEGPDEDEDTLFHASEHLSRGRRAQTMSLLINSPPPTHQHLVWVLSEYPQDYHCTLHTQHNTTVYKYTFSATLRTASRETGW
jgi:hypothetical protein